MENILNAKLKNYKKAENDTAFIEAAKVQLCKGTSFLIPSAIFPKVSSKPMIWDETLQKYVKLTKIKDLYYKLNELNHLIVTIREYKIGKFTQKECPLEILDEHYRLSRILMEEESYEWNCPFCNEKFST